MIATEISRLAKLERGELVFDTSLTYDGITAVRLTVTKRQGRFEFSDDGGAVAAAGVDPKRFAFADGSPSASTARTSVGRE
jgi:hypothetical protein